MLLTIVLTFVIVVICVMLLAIGWLITGKSKIQRGACGKVPGQDNSDCPYNQSCSLCDKNEASTLDK